jgi:hypothetical protein
MGAAPGRKESSPSVDWTYGLACLLGAAVFLVGPWIWYAWTWLGVGPGDRIDGAAPAERAFVNDGTFLFALAMTWLFVMWRVGIRRERGHRVDGGLALVILGALEAVAMIGFLAVFSP